MVQKSIMSGHSGRLLALALGSILPFVVLTPSVVSDGMNAVEGFNEVMCDSDMECEEATGYPYDVAITDALLKRPFQKYPRLVGHGCAGAAGPIYAFEEDHLPKCREIVAMDWDWKDKQNANR